MGMADNSRRGMSAKKVYPEKGNPKEKENIFILCDTCFWCAAYFGKFMLPVEDRCPICLIQNFQASQYYLTNHLLLIMIKNMALT